MSGDTEHGKTLVKNQATAGALPAGIPFAAGIDSAVKTLRDGIYAAEDSITDDPVALSYGLSNANRGCWVCGYLKAGIVITLLYGAVVLIYRAVRHKRKNSGDASGEEGSAPGAPATASA